ncbi:hypothetical protein ABBQ32_012789 [Trebouxia sp. C0010 RCD-2024]
MTPVTGLLAAERNLGDIHDKRSGTGDDQESRSQRLAAIAAYYKEATEATRRCLSQPTVERATVSVVGFRVDCDSAEGSCSTAYRQVHAMAFATGLSLLPDTSQAMDSNKPAGPRLSESETPLSERSDGSLFFSQDASEAALNCTLESIRQKLQDRADDDGKETNRQAASGPRLPGPKHSLAVSQEDMPTEVEELADTELTSLYLASALTCTDISETEAHPDCEDSSSQTMHLQHGVATTSTLEALLPVATPSLSPSSSQTALPEQSPSEEPIHLSTDTIDLLLTAGSSSPDTCSRCRSKKLLSPRIKRTRSRRTKHRAPPLRPSLLSRTTSPYTPGGSAEASEANMHGYSPLQDVDSQPCGDVWQKLGSSLSAVWRWLCRSGSGLMQLGRKLRMKLLTTLGLGQEEAQRLLAQQQAEDEEALRIRPYRPLQPVEQPQGYPRLLRWRN